MTKLLSLNYQESYLLFRLIAKCGHSKSFGKEEGGTKGLAKHFDISISYVNSLLKKLREKGLVISRASYRKGRGKGATIYQFTRESLDEIDSSACLFQGDVKTSQFSSLDKCYEYKYSSSLSGKLILERWVVLNLLTLAQVNPWSDKEEFTQLEALLKTKKTNYKITTVIEKLRQEGVIHLIETGDQFSPKAIVLNGFSVESELFKEENTQLSNWRWFTPERLLTEELIPNKIVSTRYLKRYYLNYDFDAEVVAPNLGGNKDFDIDALKREIVYLPPRGLEQYHRFMDVVNFRYLSPDVFTLFRLKVNKVASIILSEHSEILLQEWRIESDESSSVSKRAWAVYQELMANSKISNEVRIESIIPERWVKLLSNTKEIELWRRWFTFEAANQPDLSSYIFLDYIRVLVLNCLYYAFCTARNYALSMKEIGEYEPQQFNYQIGYRCWTSKDYIYAEGAFLLGYIRASSKCFSRTKKLHVFWRENNRSGTVVKNGKSSKTRELFYHKSLNIE